MQLKRMARVFLDFVSRLCCKTETIKSARLAYNPLHTIFVRQYYLYCVDLIRQNLTCADAPINVIVGDYDVSFGNRNRTTRIDIQFERTLVKPGGRDSEGAVSGKIPIAGSSESYLARIQNFDYLNSLDIVIDYSLPNLINLRESGNFEDYLRKTIHVSPLIYAMNFGNASRSGDIMTLISDTGQSRRRSFLDMAMQSALPLENVKRIFDKNKLRRLYENTKILVNIHQTDYHDTLEELRILPALLCGVVIVSEDVPLKENVPYSQFVIWSSYEKMIDTVRSVYDNYEDHFQIIFGNPELADILEKMKKDNIDNVEAALLRQLR